ncbi:BTAD domain-containing putative transcriptional regulator [Streptomyces antibioticus]|uniref:AfsR/SARP family transcriptional regulator n=1 Tax=Streptomyces antibioticus TaxID=1890 RepID=UPI0037221922
MSGTTSGLWCGLLGPLLIRRAGTLLDLGPRTRRVLALRLLLEDGRAVSTDRLCEDLWPGRPTSLTAPSLHTHISRLRTVLERGRTRLGKAGLLVRESHGYALRVPPEARDTVHFEQSLARAERCLADGRAGEARAQAEYALSLWRGAALEDARDHLFAAQQVTRLETARTVAEELHVRTLLHDGDIQQAVSGAEALTARHPLREAAWGVLMCALYLAGRHADALSRFEELRKHLAEELGSRPSPGTSALQEAVLRHDVTFIRHMAQSAVTSGHDRPTPSVTLPSDAAGPTATDNGSDTAHAPAPFTIAAITPGTDLREPPLTGAPSPRPAELPAGSPFFVGRRSELALLERLSGHPPYEHPSPAAVLIGGMPGVGKTTLALHFAHRAAARFPDGQLFSNLRDFDTTGPATDPAEVLKRFLTALGVPPPAVPATLGTRTALLRTVLAGRRVLFVLDNARDEEQVRPLLPAAPGCMVVVTSRNQLEGLVPTGSTQSMTLDVPPLTEGLEALTRRLGTDRVAAEPEAAEGLVRFCASLPLALAVAAARATLHPEFSLRELAADLRTTEGTLDAFSGTGDSADVRTVFSWSYRSLSQQAARLFRLLALHPGPDITAAAAASLTGLPHTQTHAALTELTRTHMLGEPAPGRYVLHDLLRVYAGELAREQETEEDRAAARHRVHDHYLHTAPHRLGPDPNPQQPR